MENQKFPSGESKRQKRLRSQKEQAQQNKKAEELKNNKRRQLIKGLIGGAVLAAGAGAYKFFTNKKETEVDPPVIENKKSSFEKLAPYVTLAGLGITKDTNPDFYLSQSISGLMKYPAIKDLIKDYFEKAKVEGIDMPTLENEEYMRKLCISKNTEEILKLGQIDTMVEDCFWEQNYFFNNNPQHSDKAFVKLNFEGVKSLTTEQSGILGEIFANTKIKPELSYKKYTTNNEDFHVDGVNILDKIILNDAQIYQSFKADSELTKDVSSIDYNKYKEVVEINEIASLFFTQHYKDFVTNIKNYNYGKMLNLHVSEFIGDVASFKVHPIFLLARLNDYWVRCTWDGPRAPNKAPANENPGYAVTNNIFMISFQEILLEKKAITSITDFENKIRSDYNNQLAKMPPTTLDKEGYKAQKRQENTASLFKMLNTADLQEFQNKMVIIAKDILSKIEQYKK